jgi:hypothetical protein
MTLPVGQISFNQVNVELTRPSTSQLDLNDSTVRGIAAVGGSGTVISMNDLRGKAYVGLVISSDTLNYNVYSAASSSPAYNPGVSFIQVTVNPGIKVGSSGPGTAISIPSQFSPTDNVRIVNQGQILGLGGNGGLGGGYNPGFAGSDAITTQRPVFIDNQGTIAGGGGGGAGGASASFPRPPKQGGPVVAFGGGGGGGAGYDVGLGGSAPGGNAGANGTTTSGGAGGAEGVVPYPGGVVTSQAGGPGGGLGGSGTPNGLNASGGGPGNYIVGNPFVTWINNGTRQGGVA